MTAQFANFSRCDPLRLLLKGHENEKKTGSGMIQEF